MEHEEPIESIGIIGMACRFPGAENVGEFWHNLYNGVESLTFFTGKELEAAAGPADPLNSPGYVAAKAVLDQIERFDASFFGCTPREAETMDPQHRLFMECSWEALENSGYDPGSYAGRIGVYGGAGFNTYLLFNLARNDDFSSPGDGFRLVIGNDKDHITTRVSYKFDLRGPSVGINTACSTSLAAVQLACQGLLNYRCDIALAGGVTVIVPPKSGYFHQEGGIHSIDGHCRPFDARASGTVDGSGVGIVVLKRLEEALADGDCIHAVIKGSAMNNDGSLKVGYASPGIDGQAEVIAEAQDMAGVNPDTITYIETHGTGTALGDPIEIAALTKVFRAGTDREGFCAIGSVKSNFGHLDTAAGVAGLIKTTLSLEHRMIPPSLHFENPNPAIDFSNSPFYVNNKLSKWESPNGPLRAGVSSFGIGGTNIHVVLEEAPKLEPPAEPGPVQLLILSARTSSALETATVNAAKHLKDNPHINLADVSYTLQTGRRAFSRRRMLVCGSIDEAREALETMDPGRVFTRDCEPGKRPVVFMFPGQGTQFVNMASGLYRWEPLFREQVDLCSEILKPILGIDLRHLLSGGPKIQEKEKRCDSGEYKIPPYEEFPGEGRGEPCVHPTFSCPEINRTEVTQPAIFVVEYAMAKVWMEWGVYPKAMIGHSIGEYTAACLAGVFSLPDALRLVAARGQLIREMPGGGMLSVFLAEKEILPYLTRGLSLAAVNGPSSCVVSGPLNAIEALMRKLAEQGAGCRRLQTSHAFHSEMMEPILERFKERVAGVTVNTPRIPYISNVTGTWITGDEVKDPGYWARHLRHTVRFEEGMQVLFKGPSQILLEVGPGRTLAALAKRHPDKSNEQEVLTSIPHPEENRSDPAFLMTTLGKLWLEGVRIDWTRFYRQKKRYRLPLPTYPFERQRYWIGPLPGTGTKGDRRGSTGKPAINPEIDHWFYVPTWKRALIDHPGPGIGPAGTFLVFMDECGLGAALTERLKQENHQVIGVRPGKEFGSPGESQYTINPREPNSYDRLIRELQKENRLPGYIVHLWGVTPPGKSAAPPGTEAPAAGAVDKTRYNGFYSLVFLAQALETLEINRDMQIFVVSNNIQEVTGEERLNPDKALILGPIKTIPQENLNLDCRSIDIVIPEMETWRPGETIDQLLAEFAKESAAQVIAYRGGYRWEQTFEPVELGPHEGTPVLLRPGGVYLITGGLGGIGLAIADYLAGSVRARLILLGRSAFPSRDQWEEWQATHEEQEEVSIKIRRLKALEGLGAEILVKSADVTDKEQVEAAIREAQERFGAINGVIHAGGIYTKQMIEDISPGTAEKILAPKVEGTRVLDMLFKNREPDFLILFSSLASFTGGLGETAYCGANAFLNAYALSRRRDKDKTTISITWDGWQEFMMGELQKDSPGVRIKTADGIEAFHRILCHRLPGLVVTMYDLQALLKHWREIFKVSPTRGREREQALSRPGHARPALKTPYVAPGNKIEQALAAIWQESLGISEVGIHDNYFELGGDSVLTIQIIAKVNKMGIRLNPGQLFTTQTIAELAGLVDTKPLTRAEQGPAVGPVQLTPIQHWFFEQGTVDLHHFNLAFFLEVPADLETDRLKGVLMHLMNHHDALRLRFYREETRWRQVNREPGDAVELVHINLSGLTAQEEESKLETTLAEMQASLDITAGPTAKFVLIGPGKTRPARLLIILHHLVVDAVSLPILIEDLETGYRQLKDGKEIELPPKTTSFRDWANRWYEYAQSGGFEDEVSYWMAEGREQIRPLPEDQPGGENTVGSAERITITLGADETRDLVQQVPGVNGTRIDEALMTALACAIEKWTGNPSILVDMEGLGRESRFEDMDVTRTLGWFTTIYPVYLELQPAADIETKLLSVKEQMRQIPNKGIGYGVLRYLGNPSISARLRAKPRAQVSFLYLGQVDRSLTGTSTFRMTGETCGPISSLRRERGYLLEIEGGIFESRLSMTWIYSKYLHHPGTIQRVAEDFHQALKSLILYSQAPGNHEPGKAPGKMTPGEKAPGRNGYTPADFPHATLDKEKLNKLSELLDNIDKKGDHS